MRRGVRIVVRGVGVALSRGRNAYGGGDWGGRCREGVVVGMGEICCVCYGHMILVFMIELGISRC
jgi:hypothetical protein